MRESIFRLLVVALCGALGTPATVSAAPPPPFEPQFWKDGPDRAEVLAATFVGGKGNEWLAAGGFAPDGTVVLAGNVAGNVLEFPGAAVGVIGTDRHAPPEAARVPRMEPGRNGLVPKLDKVGAPTFEKPSWRHAGVTGFVVRCSPDLKHVISACRMPWESGAITAAAVGADGAIYVAGRASDAIGSLGGDVGEEAAAGGVAARDAKPARCDHAFVARLSADAARAVWVRHVRGASDAPQLAIAADGSVRFAAADVRWFDAAGKLLRGVPVPGGSRQTVSVSPTDGTLAVGGEHHSPTGREPWRCPTLNTYAPDGRLRHQLYDWGGPYVGLDNLRLVSDTAVRFVTHDRAGNLLLAMWSDGGNSPAAFLPTDVRTGVGFRGLGLTTAGAGVLSAAYLVRVEPTDYRVTAWTLWLGSRAPNKPNSAWIDNLSVDDGDGTVCMAGRAALGLWQTNNKLSDATPSGDYVAVLRGGLDAVRYCSFVPGAGVSEASFENAAWGIATGRVGGKARAMFLGGAVKDADDGKGGRVATPTANAGQADFGGGWSDGYVVLLDLSTGAGPAAGPSPPANGAGPTAASFERGAPPRGKKSPAPPADGATFTFSPDFPKWVTVDAEFRDRGGRFWPSFLYGKPVGGSAAVKDGALSVAAPIVVACGDAAQPRGEQSRRVLGELFAEGRPPLQLRFTLESIGPMRTADVPGTDKQGNPKPRPVDYHDAKGTLQLGGGHAVAVTPRLVYAFGKTQGAYKGPGKYTPDADSVRVTAWVTLRAADLGLKGLPADAEVDVRIGLSGLAPPAAAPAPAK